MRLARSVEVFARGFSQVRSRAFPHRAEFVDGIWILADEKPRKDPRRVEAITYGLEPAVVYELTSRLRPTRHFICHLIEAQQPDTTVRDAYKSMGYRYTGSEAFFRHDLQSVPELRSMPVAFEVDRDTAAKLRQGARPGLPWVPGARHFAVTDGTELLGRVRSVPVDRDSWVSDLYVVEQHRRRGYGGALMAEMMRVDRQHGVTSRVLLASTAGARLYPHLGYEFIGTLMLFCPALQR